MDGAFEAYLSAGGVQFGGDDAALLRSVADEGSVSGASAALGRSRARSLTRLEALETAFGPLVERRRGGTDGGGSRLTEEGEALLARFERLRAALSNVAAVEETVLPGTVRRVDGELATVETAAGELSCRHEDAARGDRVTVRVGADAVTLHSPDEAPVAGATSARNRFEGRVVGVERGESVADVRVSLGAGAPLAALVTVESADRLELALDAPVVATWKATATRATARRPTV